MFTPSMTNEEIEAVAYKDFLEIRGRVEIAKDKFVQRVSSHFSRQYEERYIDPNQIQLNGLLPAIYFMRTAGDRKIAPYTPDTWTEEEKKDKYLFVSEQGTMEAKLEGRVETYLTFLEPEQPGD